jgi:8-oxo-dGTP pyrophosphatase MutT (NUDIX family)
VGLPDGGVKPTDASPAATARRELEEEAGLRRVRFDTWFFLTRAPTGAEGTPDGSETVDLRWLRPADALEAGRRGELLLVFPTIRHLEELARLGSVADGLAQSRAREVKAVLPRVVGEGDEARVLLPGDPGYEG